MFDFQSRYAAIETAQAKAADGRVVTYVRRRFLPRPTDLSRFAQVTVVEGDRLDLVAGRVLGDPEQFWRICDGNDTLRPQDLTATPGRVLDVVLPQGGLTA
jgi:hypothetical protein